MLSEREEPFLAPSLVHLGVQLHPSNLCLHCHMAFVPLWVCLFMSPNTVVHVRALVIDLGPNLNHYDFI